MISERCSECGRYFDLTLDKDAEDWAYGHDCEPSEPYTSLK